MKTEKELENELKELQKQQEEIRSQLKKIEDEKNQKRVKRSNELLDKIVDSGILDFMEHSRTSCSDENPCNGAVSVDRPYPRCNKCLLMDIIENRDWDNDRWIVKLVSEIECLKPR